MPIHFQPETILYKTSTGKEVTLKNTTPVIYQTAWKMHQILVRPRLKDIDDVIHFLPHIDFEDKNNVEIFFDEIISECELTDRKTCNTLIDTLKQIFVKQNGAQNFIVGRIADYNDRTQYYSKLYNIYYNPNKLANEVCASFLKILHSKIDCDTALKYIDEHFDDVCTTEH